MTDTENKNIHISQQEYINLMAHKITHDVVAETRIDIDRLRDDMNTKLGEINKKFEQVDKRFEKLEDKIDSNFKWVNKQAKLRAYNHPITKSLYHLKNMVLHRFATLEDELHEHRVVGSIRRTEYARLYRLDGFTFHRPTTLIGEMIDMLNSDHVTNCYEYKIADYLSFSDVNDLHIDNVAFDYDHEKALVDPSFHRIEMAKMRKHLQAVFDEYADKIKAKIIKIGTIESGYKKDLFSKFTIYEAIAVIRKNLECEGVHWFLTV